MRRSRHENQFVSDGDPDDSSCEDNPGGRECALPDRGSNRRKSILSGAHGRLHGADAKVAGSSYCPEQFHTADRVLRRRIARALIFGISIPAVQVGGRLIVIATGWAMLKQTEENDRGAVGRTFTSADVLREAFYPLTFP